MAIQETTRPRRPPKRREPASWPEWREAVAAELLAQHGINLAAVRYRVISHCYCTGRTIAEAVREAQTWYHNDSPRRAAWLVPRRR